MALPFVMLATLAVIWSITWFVLAGRIDALVEQWLAGEAAAGRVYACSSRKTSGFPVRFEVICDKPVGGSATAP